MATTALKKAMRKDIAAALAKLTREDIKQQSELVLMAAESLFHNPRHQHVGVYVSTEGEVVTDGIIDLLFKMKKDVYIPNFKRGKADMKFVRLTQAEWTAGLPATMWNIRQHDNVRDEQILSSPLDLILMPGVAFAAHSDGTIKRLGHGKGYFDRFLHKHEADYGRLPYLVGLALRDQFVPEVPIEDHDVSLNQLIFENRTIGN